VSRRTLVAVVVAAVAAVLAVGLWWVWPTFTRDSRPGVLVVDDGFLAGGRRSVELRAREAGLTVRWAPFDDDWCGDPSGLTRLVEETNPHHLVITYGGSPSCLGAIAPALGGRRAVAVAEPGSSTDATALTAAGLAVVDPTRLVGLPADDPRRTCEWWERCDIDGRIAVRDPQGTLTTDGQERIARMIVAAL
jgi:hypothetical protein